MNTMERKQAAFHYWPIRRRMLHTPESPGDKCLVKVKSLQNDDKRPFTLKRFPCRLCLKYTASSVDGTFEYQCSTLLAPAMKSLQPLTADHT